MQRKLTEKNFVQLYCKILILVGAKIYNFPRKYKLSTLTQEEGKILQKQSIDMEKAAR